MITLRRTASFPAKNFPAALAWSREVCAYAKSKFGVDTTISLPYGGNPNRLCYVMTFDNLASMEQAIQKMMSDPTYMEMFAKSSDVLTVGSAVDEIWSSI